MQNTDTGILLNAEDIKLHREYFAELIDLIGIKVIYRRLKPGKTYDIHGELDANYELPIVTGCIFEDHPEQKTMKKLGWLSELSTESSLIHVPYDLIGLEAGCLFIIPSGLDNAKGRLFKVIRMKNSAVYPASITCELGPIFETNSEESSVKDFSKTSFNLLRSEEDE